MEIVLILLESQYIFFFEGVCISEMMIEFWVAPIKTLCQMSIGGAEQIMANIVYNLLLCCAEVNRQVHWMHFQRNGDRLKEWICSAHWHDDSAT